VVEADEYQEHFLSLPAAHVIVTAIDFDHPDYFSSLGQVEEAFSRFLQKIKSGYAVVPEDTYRNHPSIAWPENVLRLEEKDVLDMPAPQSEPAATARASRSAGTKRALRSAMLAMSTVATTARRTAVRRPSPTRLAFAAMRPRG
jgi:hypothetical protein